MGEPASQLDLLRIAYSYADRGWHVFPVHSVDKERRCSCGRAGNCGRPGKHPMTPNGWKDATTEHDKLAEWWGKWPNANIGIAGGPSSLLVVDVDPRNNGDDTFADLEARYGKFPETLTALTGGGGQHYYFDVRGVDGRFKGRVLGQGVELQGYGQYVVAAPSTHYSGRIYEWDWGQAKEPAFPPPWLVEEEHRKSRNQEAAGAPMDCILGVAFSASAMIGPALGPDRVCVVCPWESDHTQGSRYDSSTIVFGPVKGSRWGWFQCSHAHCQERLAAFTGVSRMHEVLRALPEKAATYAQQRIKGADRELRRVVREKWEASLVWDPRGENIIESAGNLRLMLGNMSEWAGIVAYDESRDRLFWTKQPPEVVGFRTPAAGKEITEHDWIHTSHWFSLNRAVNFKKETAADVLVAAGHQNMHNSLGAYLDSVRRDERSRLDSWLTEYCGAEDTPVVRRVGRSWLISAIARAMSPGCQVDHVLVLEGQQGSGKTSVFRVLGGEWYLGNLPKLDDKDAKHILSGAWIVEIQELAAVRAASIEKTKAFITETYDQLRPPYGRHFIKRGRRCVFGVTTNDGEYVQDSTGARRFWPVRVGVSGHINIDALRSDRDALWAEARDAYLNGEQWWIKASEGGVAESLRDEQHARQSSDPWEGVVQMYVDNHRDYVSTSELLRALAIEPGKQSPGDSVRIGKILAALGWERRKFKPTEEAARAWYWVRRAKPQAF